MKLRVLGIDHMEKGVIDMPEQFGEPVNKDLIKRAVFTLQSNRRQPYGSSPMAGKRQSAKISRRRRNYKGSYGLGISRVPRKTMSRRGRRFIWSGAFAPGTVGGRRAHPPKAEKNNVKKMNKKENRKAIRSALSATIIKDLVVSRGHKIPESYPFVVDSVIEDANKTKEVMRILSALGLNAEVERVSRRKIRAGKGKMRGRRLITRKGPLLVVSGKCMLMKSARNIPGVQVVEVGKLNAEFLAPGAVPARLAIFTDQAIGKMSKEKLFM